MDNGEDFGAVVEEFAIMVAQMRQKYRKAE